MKQTLHLSRGTAAGFIEYFTAWGYSADDIRWDFSGFTPVGFCFYEAFA